MKKIIQLKNKIIKKTRNLPNTNFANRFLINELILLNLEVENLVFDKNNNPTKKTELLLNYFMYNYIIIW